MPDDVLDEGLAGLAAKLDRAMRRGNHRQVVDLCSQFLETAASRHVDPDMLAVCHLNRGVSRRRLGDPNGGIEDANHAARLNPRSFKPHLNAALIYAQDLKEYALGLKEFDEALRLNPTSVDGLSSRAVVRLHLGDTAGAEADLRAALAIAPDHANAICNLGNLFWETRDFRQAADTYRRALALNPTDHEIRTNLALALERMGAHRAARDVLRADRRAVRLWKSKGGRPVGHGHRRWLVALVIFIVVAIAALAIFLGLRPGGA